jgi:hypothetical protein
MKRMHLDVVKTERNNYYDRRVISVRHPELYDSIIIDMAAPFSLPWKANAPKNWCTKKHIKVDIVGLIDHGRKHKQFYCHLPHFDHSANLMISVCFLYLQQLKSNNHGK